MSQSSANSFGKASQPNEMSIGSSTARPRWFAARSRLLWIVAVSVAASFLVPSQAFAKDDVKAPAKKVEKPKADVDYAKLIAESPKTFKPLIEAARGYLDDEEEKWPTRLAFIDQLEKVYKTHKRDPLTSADFLTWMCEQSRAFRPQLSDRKWQRNQKITEFKKHGSLAFTIKTPEYWMHVSPPKNYVKKNKGLSSFPRRAPWPTLISLHEKKDYAGQPFPGLTMLKRRWPKAKYPELYDSWLVCAPVTAAGQFVRDGILNSGSFDTPYSRLGRHYHVDYKRVILDGAVPHATSLVAARPIYFAGMVLRSGKFGAKDIALIQNYHSVPVYVVGDSALAKQIKKAGHPSVTEGDGSDLVAWMSKQRHRWPLKFTWNADREDKVLANWINIESLDLNAPERSMSVEVENNNIKITARAITGIALFLNDEIVDLDKEVSIEINGHLEFKDKVIQDGQPDMNKLTRSIDMIFDTKPLLLRISNYFGLLMPGRLVGIDVRPPAKKKAPEKGPSSSSDKKMEANEKEERDAARYMEKAKEAHSGGNKDRAVRLLKKVLGLPWNKQSEQATKLLAEVSK